MADTELFTLASLTTPRDGDTIGKRFATLAAYVRGSADRFPNIPVPAPYKPGHRLVANEATILNARLAAASAATGRKETTVEAAFAKASSYQFSQAPWSYLDEVADSYVQDQMKAAGLKTFGTRDDRAAHRKELLDNPDAVSVLGADFIRYVHDFAHTDTGGAEAGSSPGGAPKKAGFSLLRKTASEE